MTREERVRKIIHEGLDIGSWNKIDTPADLKPEHHIVNDLGADSLDQVELVMTFEEEFDAGITDEDAEKVETVGDCLAAYARHFQDA